MRLIFNEGRNVGALPTTESNSAHVRASVLAYYDRRQKVLCMDFDAQHLAGCEDDGSPRGCRFCSPHFPRARRALVDLSPGGDEATAMRATITAADEWYAEAERAAALASGGGEEGR